MAEVLPYTIAKSPWKRPLNWDLQIVCGGEPRASFHYFVRSGPPQSSRSDFPQFKRLPDELQLYIFSFCDAATLFQLMRVSSAIRAEASKLFWSQPDAWYWVDSNWLLRGGFSGEANHAVDFLANVEQVEVEYTDPCMFWRDYDAETITGGKVMRPESAEEIVHTFWKTLQNRFPHAKRVVLSKDDPQYPMETLPADLGMIVDMRPDGITASVSTFEDTICFLSEDGFQISKRPERRLWHRRKGATTEGSTWKKRRSEWKRQSILMPPKEFRGPVGEYQRTRYKWLQRNLHQYATRVILIEAWERYYFDGQCQPFDCPEPECDVRIEQPGEWTMHAIDTHHDLTSIRIDYRDPPGEMKAAYEQHQKRLELMNRDLRNSWQKMVHDFGEEGSEQRHRAEEAFLHQLKTDPLYAQGKPVKDSGAWFMYIRDMNNGRTWYV